MTCRLSDAATPVWTVKDTAAVGRIDIPAARSANIVGQHACNPPHHPRHDYIEQYPNHQKRTSTPGHGEEDFGHFDTPFCGDRIIAPNIRKSETIS